MKATRGHIPWSNVDRRLHSMREIWVVTASPKGRPDASPVWSSRFTQSEPTPTAAPSRGASSNGVGK